MSRAYESALRQDHVELTRDRILDATIAILARGVTELSVPAVAREAGVSVPTIYRHFKTKRGLVVALADRMRSHIAGEDPLTADSPAALAAQVRESFGRIESLPEVVRAAAANELRREIERETGADKLRAQWIRRAIQPSLKALPRREREHMFRMIYVLCSSNMLRAFRDHFRISASEAADTVAWTILTLAHATSGESYDSV